MESSNHCYPVEIKELKEDGLSDDPIEFPSYRELDKFLHRGKNYIFGVVRKSKEGKRRRKYIISSPTFEYGRQAHGTYYVITKINGEKITDFGDVKAFYLSHSRIYPTAYMKLTAPSKKSKEQLRYEKQRRRHLLLTIDTKYGSIDKAEGTPELEELRELVGAYKIENN